MDDNARPNTTHPVAAGYHIDWPTLLRIGFVVLCGALSLSGLGPNVGGVDLVALAGVVIGAYPIVAEALKALASRRMTMELSMVIAVAAACVVGAFQTSLVIVLFVLVAEVLEHMTVSRGRRAIAELVNLLPRMATIRRNGLLDDVPVDTLRIGDTVVLKPGSLLPVDGTVTAGHSFVDQSTVTGESVPVEKLLGATVFAGTINQSGTLDIRTARIGRDTAFGKIIDSVERAEQSRAPIQKTADKLAGYLVYLALTSAVFTFAVTRDPLATISVIIVAGACGVAAGTPLAILGAIGRAAARGAIIKGGLHLEVLGRVDTVVLDKTGTLTLGTPKVVEVRPFGSATSDMVIAQAATAERPSEHPIARAIIAEARRLGAAVVEPEAFESTAGGGVLCRARGEDIMVGTFSFLGEHGIDLRGYQAAARDYSEVLVASGGELLGAIGVADVIRPEAGRAVSALRTMGMRVLLLTGDASSIGQSVGDELGVDEVASELLPDDKLARVRALLREGRTVAMVGDGVNDAPALAEASVGIAMGSGTALARETADVLLLGDNLLTLVATFDIARRCRRIIFQNFWGTIMVDGAGIVLAACGFLNPLFAAFIHVSSELAFILNAARLVPPERRGAEPRMSTQNAASPNALHEAA